MVEVDGELTRRVASLARVRLSDAEVQLFTTQIREVLGYVAQLGSVDTAGLEPLSHPLEPDASLREDDVRPFARDESGKPKTLSSAPEIFQDGYKVPPIL
jgi:aspartyl-tRNA(Asn)/glutamyl-tRNA(Gln) amidotransferase subunit C